MSWVLLRGLTRESRHWGDFVPQFKNHANGEKVVALDLPGNGEFASHDSPTSVGSMVAFARQQLQMQGVQPPYRLLAMSLGGMVAVDWAQQHPGEIAALVLINTSMRPFSSVTERLGPANWLPLARLATRWNDADYAERVIYKLTCQRVDTRDADVVDWAGTRQSAPVSAANAARQLWAAARFACSAQAPACPTLVLSSAADQLVNPLCSARMAAAWQATQHTHPWAGHDLTHDDAAWVCQRVADWLSRAPHA